MKAKLIQNAHYILLLTLLVFALAAIVLGEWFGLYAAIWWWDDMLHGVSGAIFGAVGLLAIYFFNDRSNAVISPLLVGVFVLCFSVTLGVVWEMFEFTVDVLFGTAMQQWNMPEDAIVIGKSYQDMGLRDTMSDLTAATVGSFAAAAFAYVMYRDQKRTVLSVMRRVFGRNQHQN